MKCRVGRSARQIEAQPRVRHRDLGTPVAPAHRDAVHLDRAASRADRDLPYLAPGFVDRRPAILVRDPRDSSVMPVYFVLLEWIGERLVNIRDFRHARYATEGADLILLD